MTKNQIEYQKSLETKRSNMANEEAKRKQLAEEARHNLVFEEEQATHNRAQEALTHQQIQANRELGYSQITANQNLGYANLAEQNRSNLARELEQNRTNVANESLKQQATQMQHTIATEKLAADRALQNLKEDRQDRRTKAQLGVEREKTAGGMLNNLANSIVKLLRF